MADHPAAEVRLVMDCRGGDWESLDGGRRCLYRGTVRLTQLSLVYPRQLPRVVEAQVEWEQPTPTMFMPLVVVVEEEVPVEVPMTASEEESVNGPAGTSSSKSFTDGSGPSHGWRGWYDFCFLPGRTVVADPLESAGFVGGSSTAFSAVMAGVGRAREPSSSETGDTVSSSVSSRSSSGPSEGGIHGWWKAGEVSTSLSSH